MSEERIIEQANLQQIESSLGYIYEQMHSLGNSLNYVQGEVENVSGEVGNLAQEFHTFVTEQKRANRLGQAEIRIVKIRQELENRFGSYDKVRRTTIGILQANDLGIVRKETISVATEELMISAPGYWLAPCLVALAAWISDQPELARKAIKEGLNRDKEKVSLFFALVCQRAGRKNACLEWTKQYLSYQDERNLNRETMVILEAYACGLLGADSERLIFGQMMMWLNHLAEKEDFISTQREQWERALCSKRGQVNSSAYVYLRRYSPTWGVLQNILEGAYLHRGILEHFQIILEQESSREEVKVQLDKIVNSLVSDYDDEELPLRKKEQLEQYVIDFQGDEDRAHAKMQATQTVFEVHKNFTQLLTDAAMNSDNSHANPAIQKLAIAFSKQWIIEAYTEIVEQNRKMVPLEIEITLDNFTGRTIDGKNEYELLRDFNNRLEAEQQVLLKQRTLSLFDQFCEYGGWIAAGIGLVFILVSIGAREWEFLFGGILMIGLGVGLLVCYFSAKKKVAEYQTKVIQSFQNKRTVGPQIISALLAEVVDLRREFALRDAESQQVMEYLERITVDQCVNGFANANRKVNV